MQETEANFLKLAQPSGSDSPQSYRKVHSIS